MGTQTKSSATELTAYPGSQPTPIMDHGDDSGECIVTFAKGGWFWHGQKRLGDSLTRQGFNGGRAFFSDESQVGAPSHRDCPYAFKGYAVQRAIELGHTKVLWLDASMWAVRNLKPVFDHIRTTGYLLVAGIGNVGLWTSDACLEVFGISRDEALKLNEVMGGCWGVDVTNPKGSDYLSRWMAHAKDGRSFPGEWNNFSRRVSSDPRVQGHRHDQSVSSLLAWKLGLTKSAGFCRDYPHPMKDRYDYDINLIDPSIYIVYRGG
jgi:hypothetical protein